MLSLAWRRWRTGSGEGRKHFTTYNYVHFEFSACAYYLFKIYFFTPGTLNNPLRSKIKQFNGFSHQMYPLLIFTEYNAIEKMIQTTFFFTMLGDGPSTSSFVILYLFYSPTISEDSLLLYLT